MVAGEETRDPSSDGDFQKWLSIRIRQRLRKRRGSDDDSAMFDKVEDCGDSIMVEFEFGPGEDLPIFRQDAGIKGERQLFGRDHANDLSARPEG